MPMDLRQMNLLGGVNRMQDPIAIRDDEAVTLQNLYPDVSGKLRKRKGCTVFGAITPVVSKTLGEESGVDAALLALDPADLVPTNLLFFDRAGSPHCVATGTPGDAGFSWQGGHNSGLFAWTAIKAPVGLSGEREPEKAYFGIGDRCWEISLVAGVRPHLLRFLSPAGNDLIHVVTGDEHMMTVSLNNNDSITTGTGSIMGTGVPIKAVGTYRGRMVFGNFGQGRENQILMADYGSDGLSVGTDTIRDAMTFSITEMADDEIVAFAEITQSVVGAPATSALLVLGRHSAFVIEGEPLESIDTPVANEGYVGSMVINRVMEKCGCVSPETVVRTPYGLIWCGQDDVWKFDFGAVPVRIGGKLRKEFRRLMEAKARSNKWFATYHKPTGSYRLMLESSTDKSDPVDNDLDYLSIPGPLNQEWWLDLRNGAPKDSTEARWFGPMIYRLGSRYRAGNEMTSGLLITACNEFAAEPAVYTMTCAINTGAAVNQLVLLKMDSQVGHDDADPYNDLSIDHNNEIAIRIESKEFLFDDPMAGTLYMGLEALAYTDDSACLGVTVMVDGVEATEVAYQIDPVRRNTNEALLTPIRSYVARALSPDPDTRLTGNVVQIILRDLPGYVVTEANGLVVANTENGNLLDPQYVVANRQTASGFYSTAYDYAQWILQMLRTPGVADPTIELPDIGHQWNITFADAGAVALYDPNQAIVTKDGESFYSADLEPCRRAFSLLGFDVSLPTSAAAVWAAVTTVRARRSQDIEIAAIILRTYNFSRRPTDEKE